MSTEYSRLMMQVYIQRMGGSIVSQVKQRILGFGVGGIKDFYNQHDSVY